MGLENRDYLRDEARRYSGGGEGGGGAGFSIAPMAPMCKKLLIGTIAIYVLQMLAVRNWTPAELQGLRASAIQQCERKVAVGDDAANSKRQLDFLRSNQLTETMAIQLGNNKPSIVQEWLQLDAAKVFRGQIWRLLTYALCHDMSSLFHIFFNMLLLFMIGPKLESMYGSREFLWFYCVSAVAASLFYMLLGLITGDAFPMIGASGAVMGILVLIAMNFPRQVVQVLFVFPVELRWIAVFYAVITAYPLLRSLSGANPGDNVAHAAHMGGMVFGYFYFKQGIRLSKGMPGLSTWWRAKQRGLKVVGSEPVVSTAVRKTEKLKQDVDAILQKISDQGESALSNAERKTLEKASRELRDRRSS